MLRIAQTLVGSVRHFSVLTPEISQRIARKSLLEKVVEPKDTVKYFKDGDNIGWSGFTPSGYPKAVPVALADWVEDNNLQGKIKFNLFVGASSGAECEDRWAKLDILGRRWPYQTGKNIKDGINTGRIDFGDTHLSMFAQNLAYGFYTKDQADPRLDVGVIEATEILEDGSLVLGAAVGSAPEVIEHSKRLIVEVNTAIPSFKGRHDIVMNRMPPHREPFSITKVDDKIGTISVPVDIAKIVAIVEGHKPDNGRALGAPDEVSETIAGHIIEFFRHEVKRGRLPESLLPLQSGVGNIANAVTAGLANGPFEDCTVFTEVLQDTMLDFFDSGKLKHASTTALSLSGEGFERLYSNWNFYTPKITIRPQQITNSPEIIRRLGVIAMNTPVEVDIYGHAASAIAGGTKMINGLGGSGDFLRNAYLSIMHTPSVRGTPSDPTGISTIIPKATHVDHTEHDLDIIVTEQGLADLRGLAPRQRAKEMINKCAHPDYKDILHDYFDRSLSVCLKKKAAHEPHLLSGCYDMHLNLEKNATMKVKSFREDY